MATQSSQREARQQRDAILRGENRTCVKSSGATTIHFPDRCRRGGVVQLHNEPVDTTVTVTDARASET